jgi:hypothetical protein
MYSPILAPIVTLVAWSLVMMTWMYVVRFPAMRRKGIRLGGRVGSKGGDLDGVVEPQVQWKAHNYNHLMEQPTLFYAVALSLALMDFGGGLNLSRLGLCRLPRRAQPGAVDDQRGQMALHAVHRRLDRPRRAHDPRASGDVLPPPSRVNEAASSTWVDQRNWPTGLTQESA